MPLYLDGEPLSPRINLDNASLRALWRGEDPLWQSGPVRPKRKLLVVGDSTSAVFPPNMGIKSLDLLLTRFDATLLAVPGETINQQRARWTALSSSVQQSFDALVFVGPGLNDISTAGTAATKVGYQQAFVNQVRAEARAGCLLLQGAMIPCAERWYIPNGPGGGAAACQQWVDMNAGFAAVTGVDGYIDSYVAKLAETRTLTYGGVQFVQPNCLATPYDIVFDKIHQDNVARVIMATDITAKFQTLGLFA